MVGGWWGSHRCWQVVSNVWLQQTEMCADNRVYGVLSLGARTTDSVRTMKARMNELRLVPRMSVSESVEDQVRRQIALAEKNCDRRVRFVVYGSVVGFVIGLCLIWIIGLQPAWVVILGASGGVAAFVIHESSLKHKAKCPRCGGTWEMEGLRHGGIPVARFYLLECPFCKLRIRGTSSDQRAKFW